MSSLVDKILAEIATYDKELIGSGMEHDVYASKYAPDKVFKVANQFYMPGNHSSLLKMVRAYHKAPEIVAKIYRVHDRYLEIEKLDTKKVRQEHDEFKVALKKLYDHVFDAISTLASMVRYKDLEYDRAIPFIKNPENGVSVLWAKWEPFLERAAREGLSHDLHRDNVGYDKAGNLKLLDV